MKNPNGFGSVVRLSGARRRPFMARITVGYRDNGQPIYRALDYFARREDALVCLAKYNDERFNLEHRDITFSQLYEKLREDEFPKLGDSLRHSLAAARGHCKSLDTYKYRLLRKPQMQACIDNCGLSYATQTNIRNLFWHLDRLAFDLDVISKRYPEALTVEAPSPRTKTPFSDSEVARLWASENPTAELVIFLLYTGFRMSEMLALKVSDVDLERGVICGGTKTAAGKNRLVPIHAAIMALIATRMAQEGFLFPLPVNTTGNPAGARKQCFARSWAALMEELGMNHTSHDCRHTFRSKLDSAGANKVCIDLIMGHKSSDVGERVYTHKTLNELRETVEKLCYDTPVSNA